MNEPLLILGAVAVIVFLVVLSVVAARLRARFLSWVVGRVRRSMSWMGRPGSPSGGREQPKLGRQELFDAMEGRDPEVTPSVKEGGKK